MLIARRRRLTYMYVLRLYTLEVGTLVGDGWNPENPGIQESWNHEILEPWNLGTNKKLQNLQKQKLPAIIAHANTEPASLFMTSPTHN